MLGKRAAASLFVLLCLACSAVSAQETRTVHGIVLEDGSGDPLPGFKVYLETLDLLLEAFESDDGEPQVPRGGYPRVASVFTDSGGRFELRADGYRTLRVVVEPRDGWTDVEPEVFVVRREEVPPPGGIVFRARRERRAPLRMRLVRRDSGAPLPDYELEVSRAEPASPPEFVVTDREGRFVTETVYPEGRLRLRLIDHLGLEGAPPRFEPHDHLAGDVETPQAIDAGPAYRLEVELAEGVTFNDLVAELSAPGREPAEDDSKLLRAPLRAGATGLWVRFHEDAPASIRPYGPPWVLWLRSADERWAGSAEVDRLEGDDPQPVRLRVASTGAVTGNITDAAGEPLAGTRVGLTPGGGETTWTTANEAGTYRFDRLPPDRYRLVAFEEQHLASEQMIAVAAGDDTVQDVELVSPDGPVAVSGTVISRAGLAAERLPDLLLESLSRPGRTYRARLQRAEGGDGVLATFVLDELAIDEYRLQLRAPAGSYFRWELSAERFFAPASGVEVTRRDDEPTVDLAFRVVDAETGEQVERARATLDVHTGEKNSRDCKLAVAIRDYPLDADLRWIVGAPGYAPAFGELSAFREDASAPAGSVRTAVVELREGWGTRFRVSDPDGRPLAGVLVLLDGKSAGATDSTGTFAVYRTESPETAEVRLDGWSPQFAIDSTVLARAEIDVEMTRRWSDSP